MNDAQKQDYRTLDTIAVEINLMIARADTREETKLAIAQERLRSR